MEMEATISIRQGRSMKCSLNSSRGVIYGIRGLGFMVETP